VHHAARIIEAESPLDWQDRHGGGPCAGVRAYAAGGVGKPDGRRPKAVSVF
jgi:hypothetical protein